MPLDRGVFDLESNDLLRDGTIIWCICLKDLDTGEVFTFPPDKVHEGLELLSSYRMLIGHNICMFDIPFIKKLHPSFTHGELRDTYVMSKLFDPERWSGHSLDSYGKQFKLYKPENEDWSRYTDYMLYERCVKDVEINHLTYDYLFNRFIRQHDGSYWDWLEALELEQEFAMDQAYQELTGVDIDVELANEVIEKIDKEVDEIDLILKERLPLKVHAKGNPVMKIYKKNGEYTKQVLDWL